MAKIKEIVKKLEDNSYERISLGATNVSELINDSNYITAADLPVDAVVIPFAEQYHIAADEKVGEEYCRALMDCFDENDNLIRDIYILVPSDNDNLLSLNSYQNKGTDSSGNKTKVLDFSILYDNDAVFFIVVQVTLITDANKENVAITMEIKSHTDLQRKLTFDKVPTKGSHYNPVTSDGIKTYVDNAVPTKLSVLTNDSGFITNTVTNLTNYYTKSETYTQDEVKALIDAITTLNIEVVTELPTENISATTIYLKGAETTGANDYEEWIYVNNDWELIGTTAVDLSNYYNKIEANGQFAKLSLYEDTTIRIGRVEGSSIGDYSATLGGTNNIASGTNSIAIGSKITVTGSHSFAAGSEITLEGNDSHAEGYQTSVSGDYSHAEGQNTEVTGDYSHAEGLLTKVTQNYSHAEGNRTIAAGECQHVQGKHNIEDTESVYAHIVGNGNYISGRRSNAHTLDWNGNAWFSGDVYIKSTSGTNKDEGSKRLITEDEVTNMLGSVGGDISLSDPLAYEAIV